MGRGKYPKPWPRFPQSNPTAALYSRISAGQTSEQRFKETQRLGASLHEGGHATVAYLQGDSVGAIEVFRERGKQNGVVRPLPRCTGDTGKAAINAARISLGGPLIEWILWRDVKRAVHDVRDARDGLMKAGFARGEAHALILDLAQEVKALLVAHWPLVMGIAHWVYRYRRVIFDALVAMEKAIGLRPQPRALSMGIIWLPSDTGFLRQFPAVPEETWDGFPEGRGWWDNHSILALDHQ